jgi:Tfp pilus assembly protein PilF
MRVSAPVLNKLFGWWVGGLVTSYAISRALSGPVPSLDQLDVPIAQPPAALGYAQGLDLLEVGRFAEAATALNRSVQDEEENGDYWLARGVALLLSEKVQEGRSDLERAYRLRPKDAETGRMLAFALRMQGDEINAPRYYSNGSTEPFDKFLLQTGNDYGALVRGGGVRSEQYQQEIRQRRQRAIGQFASIGQAFARSHKKGEVIGHALFGRGVDRFKHADYAGAEEDFLSVLQQFSEDFTSLYYHAASLIQQHRLEQGRQEISTVLCWKPALVEGYCQRAIAAGRMGDLSQAERDLRFAGQLDPKDARHARAPAEKIVAECTGQQPGASAAKLYQSLKEGAQAREPFERLVGRAQELRLAVHAHALSGDEVYQEQRRELAWALEAEPHNPDRMAALGKYLLDEADVRGECVEPNGQWVRYRRQWPGLQERELNYARELFNSARKINPKHIPSLIGLAALEIRNLQYANAETILRQALQIRQDVPEMLELMSRVMQEAADQRSAKSADLRQVKTWTEYGYNVIWHYTRYPSLAELDRADQYDKQAGQLVAFSKQYFQRALKACAGTAQGFYYQGVMDLNDGNIDAARQAVEQAARLAPDDRRFHYSLANIYAKLDRVDASVEQDSIARNLEQTTAAPWLQRAWSKIVNNAWKTSQAALDKAAAADLADARIPAYKGTLAEGQGHNGDAVPFYRAALAIEEAHLHDRGTTSVGGAGVWPANDFGRGMALRLRLGRLLQPDDPAQAAQLFLENVALEDRITEWGFSVRVQTAMLPDPKQDLSVTPSPPIAAALLRSSRALAAIALTQAGQFKDATAQFDRLATYEHRLRGGGTANLEWGDPVSQAPSTALFAAQAFDGAGDLLRANQWLLKARHLLLNGQGQQDPLYSQYERLQQRIESELCAAYTNQFNQAVSEIRSAAPAAREQVRESWEQKLRSIYSSCEICLRDHHVEPPWQTLTPYNLGQVGQPTYGPRQQFQPSQQPDQQKQFQQQSQAALELRTWMEQELQRIRSLPADQQAAAMQELQRKILQRQAASQPSR